MKSFLPTGQLPIYSLANGGGVFINKKPDFIIMGMVRYEKGLIELNFKENNDDFVFNPDAPEYKLNLDIASLSILKTIVEGAIDNSYLTGDQALIKIANTVGPSNLSNQTIGYLTSTFHNLILQIAYKEAEQFKFKSFIISGYFQLKAFLELIKTSEKLLLNTFGNFDVFEKYQKGVGTVPPAIHSPRPVPPKPVETPPIETPTEISQPEQKMDSAPTTELAPVNQSAPVKPGDEIADIPSIPDIPVI